MVALYQKMRLAGPQRALAAAVWQRWRRQRAALDKLMHSAVRMLGSVLRVTDLRTASISDLAEMLGSPDAVAAPAAAAAAGGLPPLWPAHSTTAPEAPQGLAAYASAMSCTACRYTVRGTGTPCAPCAGRLSRKMLGVDPKASADARAALQMLQTLQQQDADETVDVMLAAAIPGIIFSASQIAMQVPILISHGIHLVDWLHLCMMAAQQIQHDERMSAFASHSMDVEVVIHPPHPVLYHHAMEVDPDGAAADEASQTLPTGALVSCEGGRAA